MALIFVASSDPESGPRGSRLLGPILHWFAPDLAPATFEAVVVAVRKVIHFVTFGLLAILVRHALVVESTEGSRSRVTWLAWVITVAYAISDEIHQAFVPTRVGAVSDVLIDSAGALVALGVVQMVGRFRSRR